MTPSMSPSRASDPVRTLDRVRPTPAKASLPSDRAVRSSDAVGPAFNAVVNKTATDAQACLVERTIFLKVPGQPEADVRNLLRLLR